MAPYFIFFTILVSSVLGIQPGLLKLPVLPSSGRIIGGVETTIEDVPYQCALLFYSYMICGGSIIRDDVVATAAHCVGRVEPSIFNVRAGTSFHEHGGELIPVSALYQHESYDPYLHHNDFAIVVLATSITLSSTAAIISLPPQGLVIERGTLAQTSGWGATTEDGPLSETLLKVVIPIVDSTICTKIYSEVGVNITDEMICAGNLDQGGKGPCQGDSGGPLVVSGELVGITSWGYGCASAAYPGVWARVAAVRDWFDDKLSKNLINKN